LISNNLNLQQGFVLEVPRGLVSLFEAPLALDRALPHGEHQIRLLAILQLLLQQQIVTPLFIPLDYSHLSGFLR